MNNFSIRTYKLYRKLTYYFFKIRDRIFCTLLYPTKDSFIKTNIVNADLFIITAGNNKIYKYYYEKYKNHCFDILGTGWINVNIDKFDKSIKNARISQKLNNSIYNLFTDKYCFINWHKDFKTDYEWDKNQWYKATNRNIPEGSDIKIPWELSRLQHLPKMALLAINNRNISKELIYEFQNQVFDFILNNPPRIGVNWGNAMEVSIRSVNILIAYDLFSKIDKSNILSGFFVDLLYSYLKKSVYFILNNLELSGNHYLANLTGLIYITNYLQDFMFSNLINKFAINEFLIEFDKQFYSDGGNYESSSGYHRFSLEMSVLSFYLIMKYNKKNVNTIKLNKLQEKLEKSLHFMSAIIKPDGNLVLYGDFDSGKFLDIFFNGQFLSQNEYYSKYIFTEKLLLKQKRCINDDKYIWDENAIYGLSFKNFFLSIINSISNYKLTERRHYTTLSFNDFIKKRIHKENLKYHKVSTVEITIKTPAINLYVFSKTGIAVWKSDNFYLLFNCSNNGQNGNGGHSHNDKLSFELQINGNDVYRDPGVYSYTHSLEIRNKYRSDSVHNVIHTNISQNKFINFFKNTNDSRCYLLYASKNKLIGYLTYKGVEQIREIKLKKDKLIINDYSSIPIINPNGKGFLTNGYGKMLKKRINLI